MKKIIFSLTICLELTSLKINAQACFNYANNYAVGGRPNTICYSDFNQDGHMDIATATRSCIDTTLTT